MFRFIGVVIIFQVFVVLLLLSNSFIYSNLHHIDFMQTFEISKPASRRIDDKELLCYLKHSSKMIRTTTFTHYAIVACYPVSESASSQHMPFEDSV